MARAFGALKTPDVYVFDGSGALRYRGAPDSDYDDPSQGAVWLREAVDAVLEDGKSSGPKPSRSAAASSGRIKRPDARSRSDPPPESGSSAGPRSHVRSGLMERRRLIRVPASSANLGPGYDALAAAIGLHLEVDVEEGGEFEVVAAGLDVPTGRDNLVVRAFETLRPADGLRFVIRSEIPLARGLGSSAAAIVAGLYAADHLYELALSPDELFARAAEIEGHPDNVAAAVYGGFVACSNSDGRPAAARFDPPEGLEGILVVPPDEIPTEGARAAIPAEIPLADAVANVGRRGDARARSPRRRPRPDLARPHRPHPPAAPARPLSALDRGDRVCPRGRRPRRHDLGCRPDGAGLDHVAGDGQGRGRARAPLWRLGRGAARVVHPARRRRARALDQPELGQDRD